MKKLYKIGFLILFVISYTCLKAQCVADASFKYTVLEKRKVQFNEVQDSATHYWEVFDKGANYTGANPIHSFTNFGNYRVCHYITLYDSQTKTTCKDTVCNWVSIPATCTLNADFELEENGKVVKINSLHPELNNKWYINNDSVSSNSTLNYTFDTIGKQNICHVVSYYDSILMKLCIDSICKNLTLYDMDCDAAFNYTFKKGDYNFTSIDTSGSHEWSFGDGNTSLIANPKHSYTKDSNYTVKHIVNKYDGDEKILCSDTISRGIAVVFVGIKHINKLKTTIYPNPAKENININFSEFVKGKLVLFNSLGIKIEEHDFRNKGSKQITFSLSHLPPGYYWFRIYSNSSSEILSFIKD